MAVIDKKIKKVLTLACREAGKILLKGYQKKKRVKSKGQNDWVTSEDIKIEKLIIKLIRKDFPNSNYKLASQIWSNFNWTQTHCILRSSNDPIN